MVSIVLVLNKVVDVVLVVELGKVETSMLVLIKVVDFVVEL